MTTAFYLSLLGFATGAACSFFAMRRRNRWHRLKLPMEITHGTESGNRITLRFDPETASAYRKKNPLRPHWDEDDEWGEGSSPPDLAQARAATYARRLQFVEGSRVRGNGSGGPATAKPALEIPDPWT